ncbi:hypothetical protein EN794_034865 [Mesorhizobium sp. M00.F.Ca.ET.151.01.1.1]|nr:hypothetical protein EN842_25440 [bacterium M00.F.Ca.ET.199.01.1.1]TGS98002.1 hypothetical protein EN820_37430 [bacterium M00.F.Ca.ET.177.01.1.1]TGT59061.1 hypothetical protein EN813_030125 [Mesorhizobium sp. M00.F.Ca.ET.170.01.1.1]TGU11118.1 hypothetical protein EN806_25030 [bacterium M00.F.Ca.ET.163.01.1.1]TGU92758.1 hypothetical protein EN794_034865 [Mesorhizobium sp. M00.F.Ca.ET.151.01.1.1]TGV54686.1 hypothetical protein EN784_34210 [bacterium M00.F.Ca.ET.141.01.1.1]
MAQPQQEALAKALRFLHERGFVQLPTRAGIRRFEGALRCSRGHAKIRISIGDWDFTQYPDIEILDLPQGAPRLIPHISATGWFCYLAAGSAVLDRYSPDVAIGQCLEVASAELNRLLADPRYREGELQTEFGASWSIGQHPQPVAAALGTIGLGDKLANAHFMGEADDRWLLISADADEPIRISRVMGTTAPTSSIECWVLRSEMFPVVRDEGVPSTVGELFAWIKSWDRALYLEFQKRLGIGPFRKPGHILIVVHCPAGWFGCMFELDKILITGFGRKPSDLRQQLHTRRSSTRLERITLSEMSPDFIHGRNLSFPSLKDKRIVLVGCGAIGGYLAEGLVRLGAGTGEGELLLLDPDQLTPGNLGRHTLGMNSLRQAKVTALAARLNLEFPHAKVTPQHRFAAFPRDLVGDLVINASGEEALSEAMNFHRLQLPESRRRPMLHVWITGEGSCSQALWVDSSKYACFRCLRLNDEKRTKRFDLGADNGDLRVLGCTAFTPYSVSAPMAAAALALDMVAAWMTCDPSPRFRTRSIETAKVRVLKNDDIRPLPGCPACRAM